MTTYTTADLATTVVEYLGLLDENETPTAAMLARVEKVMLSDILAMNARGINIINGSSAEVPQEYLLPLAMRLALPVGVAYGIYTAMEAAVGIEPSERILRKMSSVPGTGTAQPVDYF